MTPKYTINLSIKILHISQREQLSETLSTKTSLRCCSQNNMIILTSLSVQKHRLQRILQIFLKSKTKQSLHSGITGGFQTNQLICWGVLSNLPFVCNSCPRIIIIRPPHLRERSTMIQKGICQKYGFNEIQTFELLERQIQIKSEVGRFISKALKERSMIPNEIMLALLRKEMSKVSSKYKGFIS